ncbi:MAG: ABC transporter permease [Kordiimonadaceae bacterium]|nr:ABC transporter permease [Kordiimonadaceae bacterium]MBO6570204.1 ABC transporter permease [Kordiimonadaceae bacterium]MBO6965698.1 ABC transporter permease [Kordiimonadaceae bacterium]
MRQVYLPVIAFVAALLFWEYYVAANEVPKFVLPAPSAVGVALVDNLPLWGEAAWSTLWVTLQALLAAALSGILFALGFSLSRTFEATLYPFAVVLQVTPVIAIAPLVLIWVGIDNVERAQVIIAWLVAFFPILANMSAGLKSVDANLSDLFRLYGASPLQKFWLLMWPTALPYLLASLKISGGLALIGGVVAEFVAGSGTATGLAWRIIEAGNRLQIEKMFAGLLLLSVLGMLIFYGFALLERQLLKNRG